MGYRLHRFYPMSTQGHSKDRSAREDLRANVVRVREEYLKEREAATQGEYSAMREFDKAMLTLSAGALGFSLSLLPLMGGGAHSYRLLFIAWLLFGAAILSTILSLFVSHLAFRKQRVLVTQDYRENLRRIKEAFAGSADFAIPQGIRIKVRRRWEPKTVRILNGSSIVSFLAALVLLISFAAINAQELTMAKEKGADTSSESTTKRSDTSSFRTGGSEPVDPPDPPPIIPLGDTGSGGDGGEGGGTEE